MKISRHLLLLFLLVSVLPLVVFGYINLQQDETTLRAEVLGRMAALAAKKAAEVKSYLAERLQNVRYLALDPRVTEEMNYLSKTYATNLSTAARYTSASKRTHQYFDRYIEKMGLLYDVFLITPQGNIVYTQKHESDFATNLLNGPYRNTQLAQAFRTVRATLEPVISGYEDYAPSKIPAMFIAAPIMVNGQFKGVFAVQLGNELFYSVAKDTVGLGVSGEAMFAQWDGDSALFTVPTRSLPDAAMKFKLNQQQIKTAPMFEALSGEAGSGIRTDYRGKQVVAAWRYLPELEWGMVIKVDADEAFAFLNQQRILSLVALALVMLFSAIAAFYFGRKLVVPLQELAIGAAEVAQGNLGRRVSDKGVDEIGLLARAFNRMTQNLQSLYDSLEQRVTKRTQELDTANKRLMEEIHVRKRTEQEILIMSQKLRESSRLLEAIVEHIPVMVFVKRASDLRMELFNRAGVALTGYPKESVIGKSNYDLWPKEQGDFFTAADRKVLASHEVMEIAEEPITCANGKIRILQTWKVALRDEKGEPSHLLGISIDITEHKQTKLEILKLNAELEARVFERTKELSDSTTRIETIIDTVADGIITIDDHGIIETMNRAVERIFGYAADEIIGQNIKILMPEPYHSQHDNHLDRYRATGEAHIIGHGREVTGQRKDGSHFPLELAVTEMWLGEQRHFTGVLRDITVRKQADELLKRAKEAAESASRSKSDFLAVMSHEIRTPMNGVIGMLDVLTQTSLNGHQAEMAKLIRESASTLLGIIEDILDFSKIEAGKLNLEQELMSIESVVEKVCSMFDYMAEQKRIELTLFIDPEIPNVLGDALRMHQILTNLINNAIKFSSGQNHLGQVMVRVQISSRSEGRVWLEFTVYDNGIGMDEVTQSRLFVPFEQADSSTKRLFGGTGLGLAISNKLVHMMGGEISVQSKPGAGSTFTVLLPFETVPQSETIDSLVTGLPCLLIGHDMGLTAGIMKQLTYAGAQVQRVTDICAAQHADAPIHPIWIWILDTFCTPSLLQELRTVSCLHKQNDIRFLAIGRGMRRRPRRIEDDLVGIDGNLLTRRTLLEAVAIAAGRANEEKKVKLVGLPTESFDAPSHNEEAHQSKRVLVAEDNEINQQVIRRQLALLGYASTIVNSGHEAFNLWKTGGYALLLTDIHMPHMDGYELTAAIRAEELTGTSHTPIIAVTANALKGEKEKCLAAGMDDYLSKPVRLENLKLILEEWISLTAQGQIFSQAGDAVERPVDVRVLQDLVGNDASVINGLLQYFGEIAGGIMTRLNEDIAAGRLAEAGAAAHRMKSSARSIGALKLGKLCEQIECMCNTGENTDNTELLNQFNEEIAAVEKYLATWTSNL